MANNFFKEQYEESAQIRRGIHTILKSDNYTDEYKDRIRRYLEGVDIDLFSKEDNLSVSSHPMPSKITLSTRQGSSGGYIEKPTYIEDELKKALDIDVDELISLPPDQRPETVLKSKFDAKVAEYNQAISDLSELNSKYTDALSDIENLKLEIESLKQVVDAEKLLTAVANNETEAANNRYATLLSDFQSALQKGIEEAIERVSLEAQVRGLQAQKEVLKTQLENLQSVLTTLQSQIQQQQEQQAASIVINGIQHQFGITTTSGWKIPDGYITKPADMINGQSIRFESERYEHRWANGEYIDLYNLSDEGDMTFTFDYRVQAGGHANPWIGGPRTVIVPPRIESTPGIVRVRFEKVRAINSPLGRKLNFDDVVTIRTSSGDEYQIGATFYRRLRSGGSGN